MKRKSFLSSQTGLTFVEVMLSIAAFSLGAVAIIQIFLTSLTRIEHITNRIYASYVIENRISVIERSLRAYKTLPFDIQEDEEFRIGAKNVTFQQNLRVSPVENFLELFQVDFSLHWRENQQSKSISLASYIMDLRLDE